MIQQNALSATALALIATRLSKLRNIKTALPYCQDIVPIEEQYLFFVPDAENSMAAGRNEDSFDYICIN